MYGLLVISLVCFAANSLLCRAALRGGAIDPFSFTAIRLISGALFLLFLARRHDGRRSGAFALAGYAAFFSLAYLRLDAGVGAFLLFSSVQITMIGWGMWKSDRPRPNEWIGLAVSLAGLALLTIPGKHAPQLDAALLMVLAGVCWGLYTLLGKSAADPLARTAGNFIYAMPIAVVLLACGGLSSLKLSEGVLLAVFSGAITSGLGYAVWYRVLPALGTARAAISQLSVPVLAMGAGAMLLGEKVTFRAVGAGALILAGVAVALRKRASSYKTP
jgi:drug/metabolite transporter (DMT)-like permease